ncbi:carotenoid oxygenase family protein [Paenibacillus sp. SI8]|uniref:carotenoid oxygenase family protein n=1 Tax=unclassified Paenibacillus TaxID=185978 RepID=UPI003464F381
MAQPSSIPSLGVTPTGLTAWLLFINGKQGNSFLLVLDAQTMAEVGRAIVPDHIPFGFHGMFTEELYPS